MRMAFMAVSLQHHSLVSMQPFALSLGARSGAYSQTPRYVCVASSRFTAAQTRLGTTDELLQNMQPRAGLTLRLRLTE